MTLGIHLGPMRKERLCVAVCAATMIVSHAQAVGVIRITEFMSEGQGLTGPGSGANRQREFFELTNVGDAPIDVSSFSYNDNNTNDPILYGSSFGWVQPGESVIMTQMLVENFRSYWQLPGSVRIYSFGQLSNLGNADTINIYSSPVQDATTLVDTLTYTSDLRGSGISRNRPFGAGTGQVLNGDWIVSASGDIFGSRLAPNPAFPPGPEYIDLANPGAYAPVPEPASLAALVVALSWFRSRRAR